MITHKESFAKAILLYIDVLTGVEVMLNKKRALITGGNSGIGKETAIALAKLGYAVVILCRDRIRGELAFQEIRRRSGSPDIHLELCDLGSLESIKSFAENFKNRYDSLEVLVNNAGVILKGRRETRDGYELQFGVNHLGHFLLTNLLADMLIKSAPARIVVVASSAHKTGKLYFEDIHLKNDYKASKAHSQSKLANVLFSYELADRLRERGVTVNCLHPGAVATKMGMDRESGFEEHITPVLKRFFQTPEEGAETVVYLASSPEVEGQTGQYYYRKKPVRSSKSSYNKKLADRLWRLSEELVGLEASSI
jgi:NAD(P)-dependent dehydrogenase (short-subunit alcohol dehydrogenase family)